MEQTKVSRKRHLWKTIGVGALIVGGLLAGNAMRTTSRLVADKALDQNENERLVKSIVAEAGSVLPKDQAGLFTVFAVEGDGETIVYKNRMTSEGMSRDRTELTALLHKHYVESYSGSKRTPGLFRRGIKYRQEFFDEKGSMLFSFEFGSNDLIPK